MSDAPFKSPDSLLAAPDPAIGGKAAGLLQLYRAGAPVPPWVLLPPGETPDDHALRAIWDALSPDGEGLAVRSSGQAEDGAAASAAGIYETRFCARAEELAEAIRAVRDSATAARAAAYARGGAPGAMAVVLQRRIAPDLSGVIFSAHPSRARTDRACVECVHGPGAALVDGSAAPTRLEVDRASAIVLRADPGANGPQSLHEDFLARLLRWLAAMEDAFDAAMDLEWSADGTGLWLLQARPITRLDLDPALRPPVPVTSWFFDQRFHEPIHPITRTALLPRILRIALEEALALRGLDAPQPLAHDYAGQIYVALPAYHRLLGNLPAALLTHDLRALYPTGTHPGRWPGSGLLGTGLAVLWRERGRIFNNIGTWRQFRNGLGARLDALPAPLPDEGESWLETWRGLDELTDEFLRIHRWSIVLADYAYHTFRWITGLLPRGPRGRIRKRLHARLHLITARANATRERAESGDPEALLALCRDYGHRSRSLDYATPTWAEEFGWPIPEGPRPRDTEMAPSWRPLARLLEMREEQRFHWERILARQRAMLLAAGAHLSALGRIPAQDAIWWLTWDELAGALTGTIGPDAAEIARRRHAHRIHRLVRRPLHLAPAPSQSTAAIPDPTVLRGIGASPGTARGTAWVCTRLSLLPESLPEGTILVLPCLDPAWTPILRRAAGLVVERGGLLSHAAIIAREYRVPLVIGVEDATRILKTGREIELDGETGVVRPTQ